MLLQYVVVFVCFLLFVDMCSMFDVYVVVLNVNFDYCVLIVVVFGMGEDGYIVLIFVDVFEWDYVIMMFECFVVVYLGVVLYVCVSFLFDMFKCVDWLFLLIVGVCKCDVFDVVVVLLQKNVIF